MRYYDCHVHLGSSDPLGFAKFLGYLRERPQLEGCNLILNTPEELAIVDEHFEQIPPNVVVVPALPLDFEVPRRLSVSGWWKVHPTLHRVNKERIPEVLRLIESNPTAGVMVHHFPWGDRLEHNTGLELVIEIARAFPQTPVVATHGGGYESWQLRAHTSRLPNVFYDFSITFSVYADTDHLRPWSQYVTHRRNRILFGSDWPSADPEPQLQQAVRLAADAGLSADLLENHLLENSYKLWPRHESK
jgi:predicted TIM-barrel fold metal-dependent hydrolase